MSAVSSCLSQPGAGGAGGLAVTITPGPVFAGGYSKSHTFGANTAVPTGGTAPYTYQWMENDDGQGVWTTGTTAAYAPSVSGVIGYGTRSFATYVCKVQDAAGNAATSNGATYSWLNLTGIGVPGNGEIP